MLITILIIAYILLGVVSCAFLIKVAPQHFNPSLDPSFLIVTFWPVVLFFAFTEWAPHKLAKFIKSY